VYPYFQQAGGIDLKPVSVELTYGLERIAMYIQNVDNVYNLAWNNNFSYGDVHLQDEIEFSTYNFEKADIEMCLNFFKLYEAEALRIIKEGLVMPAYDYCLKCSHVFNLLDARRAISVTERTSYIKRVRNIANRCAQAFLKQREEMGFPLLSKNIK
jgi:glycyl-tRNA synthetase alpha chain